MPLAANTLKDAKHQLSDFSKLVPDIWAVLQQHLQQFFPELPSAIRVKDIYITDLADASEPGQDGQLISHSLIEIVNTRYVIGVLPSYLRDSCQAYRVPDSMDREHLIPQIRFQELSSFLNYTIQNLQRCFTHTLTLFWQTPNAALENTSPKQWLQCFYIALVKAEQSLRAQDQTLTTPESSAILDVLEHPITQNRLSRLPTHYVGSYEVIIRGASPNLDWPLSGAFVLTQASSSGVDSDSTTFDTPAFSATPAYSPLALLYLPDSGFQSFSSLQALDLDLRLRLGDEIQRTSLLNHLPAQRRSYSPNQVNSLGYREIHRHLFEQCVDALIQKQLSNIKDAWASAAMKGNDNNLDALNDYLSDALALTRDIQPSVIAQNRYTHAFEHQLPDWLKTATETQKISWRLAVARLNREIGLSQAPGMPRAHQSGNKTYLLAFARDRLKERIGKDLNIQVEPDALWLVTTEMLQTGPIIYPLGTSGYAAGNSLDRTGPTLTPLPIRRSLSELALENVGALNITFALTAVVIGTDGKRHPTLTSAYLKNIVRDMDIGSAYDRYLREALLISEAAGWRKERYIALKTAQMRLDTLEALLSGQLTSQQAGWVNALLGDDNSAISAANISTRLLTLRNKPMPGLLLIAAQGDTQQLCYLPEAPDRKWFRTFGSLNELAAQLSEPALHDYVLQRTSALEQAYAAPLLKAGLTDANIHTQFITEHFLQTSYDTEAHFALRNVDEQSTTTREANIQTIKDTVITLVDITCFALPLKALIPLTLARFFYKIYEGADALQREQDFEALQHFSDAVSHLADAASDFASSRAFSSAIRVRSTQPPQAFSPAAATLKTREGMTLLKDGHYRHGVYESKPVQGVDAHYYLPDANGHLYEATYDRTHDTWLMIDQRKRDALYYTPAEVLLGRWECDPGTALSQQDTSIGALIARARVNEVVIPANLPDAQGIYTFNGRYYIQQNRVVFEVSDNLLSPNLQLVATSSSAHQPELKLRRNLGTNEWEIKRSVADGDPQWEPLRTGPLIPLTPLPPAILKGYEIAPRYKSSVQVLINMQALDLNPPPGGFRDPELVQASQISFELRKNLLRDAKTFLKTFTLPPRPAVPPFATTTPHADILRQIYTQSPGLVISENHYGVASKKILIDNMPELVKNDVKTLYLEHLQTDLHQADLDTYAQQGVISHTLNKFLMKLYKHEGFNINSAYTFLTLVTAARRHRIKIKAIDCIASYHISNVNNQNYLNHRIEAHNFYATQIIRAHQAELGPHKWVALVGFLHANTCDGIPGLAELNGAITLQLRDTLPGLPAGIYPCKGHITYSQSVEKFATFYKADLSLSLEVSANRTYWVPRERQEIDRLLNVPNQYIFRDHPIDGVVMFHRNIGNDLIETPLLSDLDRQCYLQRPEWKEIHNVRFARLNDLIAALESRGMMHVL